jgi:8-oxo-dGTP pyrophosphatase MutT (NUDIX family)
MIAQLKHDIATGNKVIMVTARADFDDRDVFLNTFKKYGVDMDRVHVYRAGNIGLKVPTEEKKKMIIRRVMGQDHYDKVIMYDDAEPNLQAFMSLAPEYPWSRFYAWHVDRSGRATEYHRSNIKEATSSSAAGVVLYAEDTGRWGFQQRSDTVNDPGLWAAWGGGREPGESTEQCALRELAEESGYRGPIELEALDENPDFMTFVGRVPAEFEPRYNPEWKDYCWVKAGDWPQPMHPGMTIALENIDTESLVPESQTAKTGIMQTDVYGSRAYHAQCLEPGCDWESRRYDRIQQAQAAAKKHAATHFDKKAVAEAFDQPYKLKWEKSDYGDVDALAKLQDGTSLSIMFNLADKLENNWGVEFYRNNSQAATGEGDAQRVFATVLAAIGQFIKKKKPNTLFFTAVKEEDPTGSRAKLYDRLVQRYATGLGYDLKKVDYPEQTGYKLTRKEQGVAEVIDPNNPWGPQGNFAGVTPVDVGGVSMKNIEVGDTVKYFGQTAKILAMSNNRKYSRINIPSDFGGTTKDVLTSDLKLLGQGMAENFADGRNPGRKGLAKRVGVNTKASISSLRKTAKNSSGEKQRMAHWLANMKAGRAKAKRK